MFLSRFVAPSLSVVAILGLAPASFAQSVLVVDAAGGPGSSFTTIGAAVAAAVDGDFVLVRAGFYPEIVTLDGIGLTIQADAGATVVVDSIEVRNLASTQFAALRAIQRTADLDGSTVRLESNRGSIWIEDSSTYSFPPDGDRMVVTDCSAVTVRNSVFLGGDNSGCLPPTPCVDIQRSSVALYECSVFGINSHLFSCNIQGGVAISVLDSRVTLHAALVVGGSGGFSVGLAGNGGHGLVAVASVVELIDTTLFGGPALTAYGGIYGAPVVTSLGAIVLQPPNRAHLMTAPSPVVSGQAIPMTFTGDAGDRVLLLVSSMPGPYLTATAWLGPLLVPREPRVSLEILPSSGTFSRSLTAPELALGDLVRSFYVQPLFLGPGEIALGTPTQVHVLDPSL